ncbi:MAG TPA: hypothetical protein VGB56_04070 [Flavisolibacter sp.]
MKTLLAALVFPCLFMTSCVTLSAGSKRPLSLVDAPADLKVRDVTSGKDLEIKQVRLNGARGVIQYCPGVKYKVRKGSILEFTSENQTRTVEMGRKSYVGILIFESIFTLGIGTIVDLATGATKTPRPEFLDIPAILEDRTPRTTNELKIYLYKNSTISWR